MKLRQIVTILLLVGIGWLLAEGWLGNRGLVRVRQLIKQYRQVVTRVGDIEKKNAALQEEIERLKKDKFWLEKQVRENLGWVKPGEVIYKFKDVKKKGNTK